MKTTTYYATNDRGHPIARLALAEGADYTDANLFGLRGNVKGASEVVENPGGPSLEESTRRADVAAREFAGLPPAAAGSGGATETPPPGSIAESEARIAAALSGMDGGARVAAPEYSHLPVICAQTGAARGREPRHCRVSHQARRGQGDPRPVAGEKGIGEAAR